MAGFPIHDPGGGDGDLTGMFGPGHVDQMIRQAVQMCWLSLPNERRNVDEVERQLQRLFDRAMKNLREDATEFGINET